MKPQRFRNRTEAGRRLAEKLAAYADRPDILVLALPRGGVPVGYEVARALGAPLDVFLVRKLGVPGYEELARRERLYRGDRPPPDVAGRTVILVDDGLATGATMRAAIRALRPQHPARIVVAVPTASPDTCEALKAEADDVICAITPEPFFAVGHWYEDFAQTTDDEVRELLAQRG